MKKSVIYLSLVYVLIMASCHEEVIQEPDKDQQAKEQYVKEKSTSSRMNAGTICFFRPEEGRTAVVRDMFGRLELKCIDVRENNCRMFYRPTCVTIDPCRLGLCAYDPFFDPWELAKVVKPWEIESLKDMLGDVPGDFGTVPINEEIAMLQFYKGIGDMLNKDVLHLRTSMELDEKIASENGFEGNVVPAGIHPVVYNEKNNTFNAFTKVTSYPVKYDRKIIKVIPEKFNGSLNGMFESHETKDQPDATLVERTTEVFRVEGEQIEGALAFSVSQRDLNFVFYGDPSPQPSKADPTPTPIKVWLDKEMWLPQSLAEKLKIKPFLLKPENLYQFYDEKEDVLRVTIINR